MSWTSGLRIRSQTLSEFLRDDKSREQVVQVTHDGEAGVLWLAGAWDPGGYIATDGKDKAMLRSNTSALLKLAQDHLQETLWFGLMEDLPRSMIMLQKITNAPQLPQMKHANRNSHPPASAEDRALIKSMLPLDMALYNFAVAIFEKRWLECCLKARKARLQLLARGWNKDCRAKPKGYGLKRGKKRVVVY